NSPLATSGRAKRPTPTMTAMARAMNASIRHRPRDLRKVSAAITPCGSLAGAAGFGSVIGASLLGIAVRYGDCRALARPRDASECLDHEAGRRLIAGQLGQQLR